MTETAFDAEQEQGPARDGVILDPLPPWGLLQPVRPWVAKTVFGILGLGLYTLIAADGRPWLNVFAEAGFAVLVVWTVIAMRRELFPSRKPRTPGDWWRQEVKPAASALASLITALWRLALVIGGVWLLITKPLFVIALALVAIAGLLFVMVVRRAE